MIARRAAAQARIASVDRDVSRGLAPALVDSFGRKHNYLRISLTERCNLRCRYCMPEEGVPLSPSSNILTNAEVVRLARIFVQHGVNKIRLTGGEPTLRHGLAELITELRGLGVKHIGMTSNGIALWRKLPELVRSGLTHLNLSLDTLDAAKFERMTLRRGHDKVLKSLDIALSLLPLSPKPLSDYAGPHLQSVKLNTVLIRNTNDSELARFLALTRSHPLSVRFIEFMPFAGNQWDANAVVPASELLERTKSLVRGGWFDDTVPGDEGDERVVALHREPTDTARTYQIRGFAGTFGFISSMSDDFCAGCNRLRITADGNFKPCLFDQKETPLRDLLRSNSPSAESQVIAAVRRAVGVKFAKHGIPNSSFSTPEDENNQGTVREAGAKIGERLARPMILIGGSVQERCGGLGDSLLDYLYKPSRHVRTPREAMTGRVRRGGFMNVMPLLERRSFVRATYTPGLLPASPSYLASARSSGSIRQNHPSASPHLTHIDPKTGRARMVDVSHKDITQRSATAVGRIIIPEHAYKLVTGGSIDNAFGKAPAADAITHGSANSSATVGPLAPSASIPGRRGKPGKGDVLATAQLAGIMAAKRTADLIPLCHPLPITHVEVILEPSTSSSSSSANGTTDTHVINVYATVRTASRTGVEMEALTAANVALLTVWDMLKAVAGQEMMIERICVSRKEGGVSGLFERTDVL